MLLTAVPGCRMRERHHALERRRGLAMKSTSSTHFPCSAVGASTSSKSISRVANMHCWKIRGLHRSTFGRSSWSGINATRDLMAALGAVSGWKRLDFKSIQSSRNRLTECSGHIGGRRCSERRCRGAMLASELSCAGSGRWCQIRRQKLRLLPCAGPEDRRWFDRPPQSVGQL